MSEPVERMTGPRENFRTDLEHRAREPRDEFSFGNKEGMALQIVLDAQRQWPALESASIRDMEGMSLECIDEIERLHNIPDISKDPPEDIDVIWVVGAPGLLIEHGSKAGWSANFPWMDNLEWENFGSAFALAEAVTAKRTGKPVEDITRDDVLRYGPSLIYNDPAWEPVATILEESKGIPIPPKKVLLYSEYTDKDGTVKPIQNTRDQIRCIRMPEDAKEPRKIAICILGAQMVRLGRLIAHENNLPKGAEILVVPSPSPEGHEREHAIMEVRGAVINTFQLKLAEREPIQYSTA